MLGMISCDASQGLERGGLSCLSSSSPDAIIWLFISSVIEMSSSGRRDWFENDLGLLGREDGSSEFSGVCGRKHSSVTRSDMGEPELPVSDGLRVEHFRASCCPAVSLLLSASCEQALGGTSPAYSLHGHVASSDRDSTSHRLCTPYMPSLPSSMSSVWELASRSEACELRDRKKVAGAAVRGSKDEEGWSTEVLRLKDGRSGAGRMVVIVTWRFQGMKSGWDRIGPGLLQG